MDKIILVVMGLVIIGFSIALIANGSNLNAESIYVTSLNPDNPSNTLMGDIQIGTGFIGVACSIIVPVITHYSEKIKADGGGG